MLIYGGGGFVTYVCCSIVEVVSLRTYVDQLWRWFRNLRMLIYHVGGSVTYVC